jgi:hypothetical protein
MNDSRKFQVGRGGHVATRRVGFLIHPTIRGPRAIARLAYCPSGTGVHFRYHTRQIKLLVFLIIYADGTVR